MTSYLDGVSHEGWVDRGSAPHPNPHTGKIQCVSNAEGTGCDHYGRSAVRIKKDAIIISSLSESAWVIRVHQRSPALQQIWRPALSYVHQVLIERHLEWCNAKTRSRLREARGSKGGEVREREKGDRRGLKGPDYCVSSRIQRVAQQPPNEIPTLSEEDSGNKRAARAEAISSQHPGKWYSTVRRADLDDNPFIHKGKRSHFRHWTGPKLPETPCNPQQQTHIQEACRDAALHKCTGLATGFLSFIFILIYFHEKLSYLPPSPVKRSAEDQSVILHRKHSSAW